MTDILDAATTDEELQDGLQPQAVYLNQKTKADYTAVVTGAEISVHDNPESPLNGQSFFRLELVVDEINGPAYGSRRCSTGGYEDVELRKGDKISTIIEMASVGVKATVKKMNFRKLAELAATFSENLRADDFYPNRDPGPLGIREVFGDGTKQVGKKVHVFSDTLSKTGWANPTITLIPEAKKAKAKKAS